MKKIFKLFMMLLLTTAFSVSLAACGDDDEPSASKDEKIHVINASSQEINAQINISGTDYSVDKGWTPYYSYKFSLEPGEEITYDAPENGIHDIYLSMRMNGKVVFSPKYTTPIIKITDNDLKKWAPES